MRQRITILGATGSVGRSTVDVVRQHRDCFEVVALVAGRDAEGLAELAVELDAECAVLSDESRFGALRSALEGTRIACGAGASAIREATDREADIVVAAISGVAGLRPTHDALRPGRRIALANKESLVCAGEAFMADAARIGATILAMDSEHNALTQALAAGHPDDVEMMVLTASGGPFRTWTAEEMAPVTPAQTAKHPTYAMGAKINVDSATLMNKGLELIEARHLFGVGPEKLGVVVHPQSIVHGLINWRDGAVTAGLAHPDMRVPIAHCLGLNRRLDTNVRRLDLAAIGSLTFEAPDFGRFPCLGLARDALAAGGSRPAVLNGANELAVAAFLEGRIGFLDIARVVEHALAGRNGPDSAPATVEEAEEIDREARRAAQSFVKKSSSARSGRPRGV